jgi:hypothetical protein
MKKYSLIIMFIAFNTAAIAQKWYSVSKNDIATMSLEMGAGYAQGWREEVLYHPNALFAHFPNLNKNFWDNRLSWQRGHIRDANHILKFSVTAFHLTAVAIKIGDYKSLPKKQRVKKILFDVFKNYAAYQLGFFLSYNLTHHNKTF